MIRAFAAVNGEVKQVADIDEILKYIKDPKVNVWVDFESPTEEEVRLLESKFEFHHLAVEDVLHKGQRPKIEDYDSYVYVIIRTLVPPEFTKTDQLNIFLGKTFVVTVNYQPHPGIESLIQRCIKNPKILARGHDFVVYSILDTIVDGYFPILTSLGDREEEIEEKLFQSPDKHLLEELFKIRRKIITIRRVVWPMRDILNVLARRDFPYITTKSAPYFRDVYDHLIRITDLVENSREALTGDVEAYLSVVSNNLNVVMKRLTAITAIMLAPTLIAGIYGMNFDVFYPAHSDPLGFDIAIGIMLLSTVLLAVYFRQQDWL